MEKANTLPLPKRKNEKSSSSPASSLLSLKSLKTDKFGKIKFMRKKKKKKDIGGHLEVDDSTGAYDSKTDVSDLDGGASEDTSETASLAPTVSSLPSTHTNVSASPTAARKEPAIFANSSKSPKIVKKSKDTVKSMIKGGKNLLPIFKNKNESAPIIVDSCIDIRRANILEEDKRNNDSEASISAGVDERDYDDEESQVPRVEDEESDDADWSLEATNKRVKKLSVIEITSVYVDDNEEEEADDVVNKSMLVTTPEYESSTNVSLGSSVPSTPTTADVGNCDQPPLQFNKKSPSTLKKEILQKTNNRKISISENSYIGEKLRHRKISVQPSTDKNELLFKILVIGELGTGKTSIIKRYVHQFFSQHYRATIGVDFALKVLSWDDNTTIRLQLWDIAGQERFGNMTRVYYKEAVGAFIVFDVTRVGTFEAVTKWKQDLDSKVQLPDGEAIPCVLLANKCDQPKEGVVNNQHKMDDFCKENQFISWFETSAKDNINIDEAANSLVTKIITNDSKRQEKEATNGTIFVKPDGENNENITKKFCSFC